MKFKSELDAREWCRRYGETYIRILSPSLGEEWHTCYLRGAANTGTTVVATADVPGSLRRLDVTSKETEFDVTFPKTGWVSLEDGTSVYLERAPYRQWKWGLCRHNSHIRTPFQTMCSALLQKIGVRFGKLPKKFHSFYDQLDGPIASAAFNRKQVDVDSARKQVMTGERLLVPLTEQVAVSAHPASENLMLWLGSHPVGEVVPEGRLDVKMNNRIFKQEVTDFFMRQGRHDVNVQ